VIAVNPYKWFHELYTQEKQCYFSNRLVWEQSGEDPRATMQPHVYEVSALSFKGLAFGEQENQSILVSGESGAGKTETVKICLNHIASVQRGQVVPGYYADTDYDPVVQRVVQSNPLLEAFGNAKTRRNDNSSRFGKFLQLQFDRNTKASTVAIQSARCGLVGSKCEVYLLEKNRVVGHDADERTFHIFYQLLALSDEKKARFWEGLRGATKESFKYVGPTKTDTIEGVKDADRFQETLDALELVNVQGETLDALIKAICVTMQLGNMGFETRKGDPDSSIVTTPQELQALSDLMGVSEKDLALAFTERTFQTTNETHKVPLNADSAKEACDALAKEIYQKTFLWLVKTINKATCAEEIADKSYGTIGLLDIFGFESFDINRFEQLCINYANEKLQQKFTEDVFASVQAEYKAEGIPLAEITYDDNRDVLDLIEGSTGLLNLLNEECIRPKGNDFDFVQKALFINKASAALMVNRTDRLSFGIQHYAGHVMYDAENFVTKNLDTLPTDLQECVEKSSNAIISAPRSDTLPKRRKSTGKHWGHQNSNINAATVWSKYKGQLNELMTSLRKTKSRYIRCIKPNNQKKPHLMEHKETVEQLRCAGVVAGITIARSCFPNRLPNSVVLARYSNLMDPVNYPSRKTSGMTLEEKRAEDCKALMNAALQSRMEVDANGNTVKAFAVGKTKTYFRAGALESLESNRMRGLDSQATTIQRAARGWLSRNKGKYGNQRKKMEEQMREAARRAEEERLARLKQEGAARKAARLQELKKLEEVCDQLEREHRQEERKKRDALMKINEVKEQSKEELEELKKQFDATEQNEIIGRKAILAQQEQQLEESKKLIMFLKKENKKVRKENAKYTGKRDEEASTNGILEESHRDFSEGVGVAEERAIKEETHNGALMSDYDQSRALNREMKHKFRSKQDEYLVEATARLELQKTTAKIITIIDNNKNKPNSVVREINTIVANVESFSKGKMAALEKEFCEECPQGDYTDTDYERGDSLCE